MFKVPDYVINALNSVTKRRMRIEWSNDRFNTVVDELDAYESEWTCDAGSQVRWSGSGSTMHIDSRINHKTTWMRAFLEIKGVRSQWWRIPMGVYRVYKIKHSGPFSTFTLDGLEAVVRDDAFHFPRTFPISKYDSRRRTLERLLKESIPNVKIAWLVGSSNAKMSKITVDKDRWALIDGDLSSKSITNSLAADCFADRVGQFVVAKTPLEPTSTPVWEVTVDSGVKVSSETELSREGMVNVWTVWADPGNNKKVIGPVHVWDSDPGSDTYAGLNPIKYGARDSKPFGIVGKRYQNPLLESTRECASVGRKRLALSLASRRDVQITSIFNPTIDAGDCMALIPDGSTRLQKFIVDSVKYQPDDAFTALNMRAQGPPAFSESAEDEEGVSL